MGIGFIKGIKYLMQCIISIIYDNDYSCINCGDDLENEILCSKCFNKFKNNDINYDILVDGIAVTVYCAAYYSNKVKELILRLKYKSDFEAGEVLARLMAEIIRKNKLNFDYITFVPSSKRTVKRRGYNQSEYLAKKIGDICNKRVISSLTKFKDTRDQIGLDGSNRWINLKDSFKISSASLIKNKIILLVDDVITTGATAHYCCLEFIKYDCKNIIVLTAAKSTV